MTKPPPIVDDQEEPTEVGPPTAIRRPCVPCGGTGTIRTTFDGTAPAPRLCISCGGSGVQIVTGTSSETPTSDDE